MKRWIPLLIVLVLLGTGGVVLYQNRIFCRDWVEERVKSMLLPPAESYRATTTQPSKPSTGTQPSVASPVRDALPSKKHLSVPFTTQAPKADWVMPYEEACEEASMLMVKGYYDGDEGAYDPDVADKMILDLVAFVEGEMGLGADITIEQTAETLEAYDTSLSTRIEVVTSTESIKRYIAQGMPVIVPADGKALENPNFRNGGPPYHMLVITGYTEDEFITNDPGTRKGFNYTYDQSVLMEAIHDWNGGDVKNGDRVMLIVRPKL